MTKTNNNNKLFLKRDMLFNEESDKDPSEEDEDTKDKISTRTLSDLQEKERLVRETRKYFHELQRVRLQLLKRYGKDYNYKENPSYKRIYKRWKELKSKVRELSNNDSDQQAPQQEEEDREELTQEEKRRRINRDYPGVVVEESVHPQINSFFRSILGDSYREVFTSKEFFSKVARSSNLNQRFFKNNNKGSTYKYNWVGHPKGVWGVTYIEDYYKTSILKEAERKGVVTTLEDLIVDDTFSFLKDLSKVFVVKDRDPVENKIIIQKVAALPQETKKATREVDLNKFKDVKVIRIKDFKED